MNYLNDGFQGNPLPICRSLHNTSLPFAQHKRWLKRGSGPIGTSVKLARKLEL